MALILTFGSTANAQDAPSPAATAATDASEIVVTGRGRSEMLQNAPAAITAFSAQTLADARVKNVSDFVALTPGISIAQSQSAGISFVTIRGVSQVRNGESPIAVVTDGVQQISSRQFTVDLFDVDQIEVLRGPQGALYGRNAIGGAIVITTQQPSNVMHAKALASYGNGGDKRFEATLSGPIVRDKLLFRLSGSYRDFDGLFHNAFLGKTADQSREANIRGQLKAIVSDSLTVDARASYRHSSGKGYLFIDQLVRYLPNSCLSDPANPLGGGPADANRFSDRICQNIRGSTGRSIGDASLAIRKTTDWGVISNVAAYVDLKEFTATDSTPFTADVAGAQTQYNNVKAFQDEFRITSAGDGRFKWMAGAYYLRTTEFLATSNSFDRGFGVVRLYRSPQYSNPLNPTRTFRADNNHNQTYAFFGSVSYKITPELDLSAAYRYDHDSRMQIIDPQGNLGVPAGCVTTGATACRRRAAFSKGQPKVTLNYRPNPSLTLFADWGVGFRSGQFNQSGAAATASLAGVADLVQAETASTTEAGIKTRFFGSKLSFNATGFYTRDRNPFYFLYVPSAGAQVLVNIDRATLYGAEFEASVRPIRGLELFANYSFTHSRITQFVLTPRDRGNRVPYIPDDTGVIGAQYRFALSERVTMLTRGDIEHHGRQYWDPENSTPRSSFRLINLRGGLEAADGGWSLTGYVKNLANKRYNAEYVAGGFAWPAPPRTYGVDLQVKW